MRPRGKDETKDGEDGEKDLDPADLAGGDAQADLDERRDQHDDGEHVELADAARAVGGTGAGDANSVVFNIQDCNTKEGSFATVASTGKIAGADLKGNVVIPMPVRHRQFVKVTTTVAGTVTGTATAYITNAPDLPMEYKKVGIDILPTAD